MNAWRIAVSIACLVALSGRLSADEPDPEPKPHREPHQHPNPKAADHAAEELVQAGLRAEAAGDKAERDRAIDKALAAAPDFAPARWQQGQVRFEGKWAPFEKAQQVAADNPLFADYHQRRDALGGSLQGQIALARWCAKHKLIDEEQVHWRAVLTLEPQNHEAIKRLGLVHVDGAWVKPAQSMTLKRSLKQLKDARDHWMPICEHLQHEIDHGNDSGREESTARLRAIDDPAAIRSMMNVLSIGAHLRGLQKPSMATNLLLVETLGNMPQQEATNALIYEILANPADEVALAAADQLKSRSLQSYVPVLLSRMETPMQGKYTINTQPDGTILYEHRYYREEAQADEQIVKQCWVRPSSPILSISNPGVAASYQKALAQVTAVAEQNQADVEQRVAGAEKLKRRIETVLERNTGQQLGGEPSKWWRYWLDFNELFVPPARPVDHQSTQRYYTYFVPRPQALLPAQAGGGAVGGRGRSRGNGQRGTGVGGVGGLGGLATNTTNGRPFNMGWVYDPLYPSSYPTQTMKLPGMFLITGAATDGGGELAPATTCFGAGTLVETLAGPMAIEQIKAGDRVLAQDPETGELAYEAVLKTTIRPPATMMTLSLRSPQPRSPGAVAGEAGADQADSGEPGTDESFLCTKGHPFWVIGKGWQMTKNLEPGDHLHAVTGSVEVESVVEADTAEAYNLIVDESHTYFVGHCHVLVHDNSFARPLLNSVPGLPPETEKKPH